MAQSLQQIEVYLEIGKKRTFAGAIDWPGWCRGGRDEESALQALFECAPRYAHALKGTRLGFHAPADSAALTVVERLEGNATTEFGAPDVAPARDAEPVDGAELRRLEALLQACWDAFDAAVAAASGQELRKGPRGGGREVAGIIEHVLGAEAGYLSQLGGKLKPQDGTDWRAAQEHTRQTIRDTLAASARGEIPARGPRGGLRWSPRYFVRRVAWHALDHAWEIEDRML